MDTCVPRHILIVDDDPAIRAVFGEIVDYEGYIPVLAASGGEACATLSEQHTHFALILLDVEMPGIDGFGVREFQLKTPSLTRIPTIVITGRHLDADDRSRLSAVAYLSKPVPLAALSLAISTHARTSLDSMFEAARL